MSLAAQIQGPRPYSFVEVLDLEHLWLGRLRAMGTPQWEGLDPETIQFEMDNPQWHGISTEAMNIVEAASKNRLACSDCSELLGQDVDDPERVAALLNQFGGLTGGMEAFLQALAGHARFAWVVSEDGRELDRDFSLRAEHRYNLARAGFIEVAVKAMATHADNIGLARNGCTFFATMCHYATPLSETWQRLLKAGCVEATLKAMAAHGHDLRLSRDGCSVLAEIGRESNQIRQCIATICKAMATHGDDTDVLFVACAFFGGMSSTGISRATSGSNRSERMEHLLKSGCIAASLKAMTNYRGYLPNLACKACEFFANIAEESDAAKSELVKAGCIEAVLKVFIQAYVGRTFRFLVKFA